MRRRAGDHARLRIVTAEAILAILAILALAACEDGENGSVKPTEQPSTGSAPAAALGGRIVFNFIAGRAGRRTSSRTPSTPMGATSSSCSSTDLRRILVGRPTAPRSRSTAAAMGWSRISSIPAPASCARWSRRIRPSRSSAAVPGPPDGERLACEGFGVHDPSLTGIYWVRSSDGADLERITSNPGGDDIPGDFSPDGDRLVFVRLAKNGSAGILRNRRRRLGTPSGLTAGMLVDDIFGGSWSPDGSQILFVARETEEHHKAIWVVNADGTSPHQLRIDGTCGGPLSDPGSFRCYSPSWSPDGTKIVFVRRPPIRLLRQVSSRTSTP